LVTSVTRTVDLLGRQTLQSIVCSDVKHVMVYVNL